MSTLDIILFIILAFGAFRGYRKGFLMEVVSILALVLGVLGAFKLMEQGMIFLDEKFDINGTLLPYLSFFLIFILILIGVFLLGKSVKTVLNMTLLGSVDNLIGAVVGMLKWAFGISILIWISGSVDLYLPGETTSESYLYPFVAALAPRVIDFFTMIFPMMEGLWENVYELLQPSEA